MIEIDVSFDDEGNSSAKVKNMTGQSCTSATKFLEDALGVKMKSVKHHEYYDEKPKSLLKSKWL